VKKLQKTSRKCRENKNEPTFPELGDTPPKFLDEVGREEWTRMLPMLKSSKVIQATDAVALAAYCQAYSRWVMANKKAKSSMIITAPNGVLQAHPAVGVSERAAKEMKVWMVELGITPAARSRVKTGETEKAPNEWENL